MSSSVRPRDQRADGPKSDRRRRCRECGCTDERACWTLEGPCYWVEEDLCSACVPRRERDLRHEFPDQGPLLDGRFIPRKRGKEWIELQWKSGK